MVLVQVDDLHCLASARNADEQQAAPPALEETLKPWVRARWAGSMSGVQSRGGGMVAGGFAAAAMGEDGGTVMAGAGSRWSGKAATQSGAPGTGGGAVGFVLDATAGVAAVVDVRQTASAAGGGRRSLTNEEVLGTASRTASRFGHCLPLSDPMRPVVACVKVNRCSYLRN